MLTQGGVARYGVGLVFGLSLCLLTGHSAVAAENLNSYLALGDSVPFGLDLRLLLDPDHLPTASQFAGYPEFLGAFQGLSKPKLIDASCPGESSASFMDNRPDYGCNSNGPQGQPPFKTGIGLHVDYTSPQLTYAVDQLSGNKKINLVTLSIGANDVLILLRDCNNDPACVGAGLPTVFKRYTANLGLILGAIRSHYSGTLILVTYYSPDPSFEDIALALKGVMTLFAAKFKAQVADGYTAYKNFSAPFGGDPCRAGLLVPLGPGICDVHPSKLGSAVLAATVEAVRVSGQ